MKLKPEKPFYNIDAASNNILSTALYDGYRDEADALNSRFGLSSTVFCSLGASPGDGLFWWDKLGILLAVSGGRCYDISTGGVATERTGGNFLTGTPVRFADGQLIDNSACLYACNGGKLNYSLGVNFTQAAAPAPQACTHVAYNGLRFIANETDTARMYFTDISPVSGEFDPEYWAATENPLTTDSRGDNISGLFQAWDDFAIWGAQGREIWQTVGGEPPLQPRLGSLSEAGLIAPYSVQKADNTFFALCLVDQKPAAIRLQGNDPVIISLDIEKLLDKLTVLTDAIGDIISIGGASFYILTFPSEQVTYAYNIKKQEWYLWSYWDTASATREAFMGRHFVYAKAWGKHLCQSCRDGKIYEVDPDATSDAGNTIRTEWQSGWLDGDTSANKIIPTARIHLKRGSIAAGGSDPAYLTLRYRDNGSLVWGNDRQISLGLSGEYEFYRRVNGLGKFRSRQFSIVLTDAVKLVFAGLDIDIRKLGA